jgi:hypothetical protein
VLLKAALEGARKVKDQVGIVWKACEKPVNSVSTWFKFVGCSNERYRLCLYSPEKVEKAYLPPHSVIKLARIERSLRDLIKSNRVVILAFTDGVYMPSGSAA